MGTIIRQVNSEICQMMAFCLKYISTQLCQRSVRSSCRRIQGGTGRNDMITENIFRNRKRELSFDSSLNLILCLSDRLFLKEIRNLNSLLLHCSGRCPRLQSRHCSALRSCSSCAVRISSLCIVRARCTPVTLENGSHLFLAFQSCF